MQFGETGQKQIGTERDKVGETREIIDCDVLFALCCVTIAVIRVYQQLW
jgi:hypothetical protein